MSGSGNDGAKVALFSADTCGDESEEGSATFDNDTDTSITVTPDTALSESKTYTYYFKLTDKAGNESACGQSTSYVFDIEASASVALGLKEPTSAHAKDRTPRFTASGLDTGDTITLHKASGCTDAALDTVVADAASEDLAVSTNLNDGSYNFYAKAQDALGNSTCSDALSYRVDNQSPGFNIYAGAYIGGNTPPRKEGGTLRYRVRWNEAVVVTGKPYVDVLIPQPGGGHTTRKAYYVSGSGESTLYFDYTVEAGHSGAERKLTKLVGTNGHAVQLNGGTIKDPAGNDAALSGFNSSNEVTNSPLIDTSAPLVQGLADDATPTTSKNWTWSCNESCTFRYVVNTSATHSFLATDAYGPETTTSKMSGSGTYYLHVQAKDRVGYESAVKSVSVILVGGRFIGSEGGLLRWLDTGDEATFLDKAWADKAHPGIYHFLPEGGGRILLEDVRASTLPGTSGDILAVFEEGEEGHRLRYFPHKPSEGEVKEVAREEAPVSEVRVYKGKLNFFQREEEERELICKWGIDFKLDGEEGTSCSVW